MARIAVVGSINMDIVNQVKQHPQPGETVQGWGTTYSPGGKGANQAVAAARAGADVTMVAAVGNDAFADTLLASLASNGVSTDAVYRKPETSGIAFITVDTSGENIIILSAGSNGTITAEDVTTASKTLASVELVLLQNEIPWETTVQAMDLAKHLGLRVLLNPAPATKLTSEILHHIDFLVLNETEAAYCTGRDVETVDQAAEAASQLVSHGASACIVTLGDEGAYYCDASGLTLYTRAFPVTPVDTTAAGDTFIGAFAVAILDQRPVAEAMRFASAASAICVTRPGAQPSIPNRTDIDQFLRDHVD